MLDRIKNTWTVLHIINMNASHFPSIKGLKLEFHTDVYNRFMQIPDALLERITDLGLSESMENSNSAQFIEVTRHLISKSRNLKYLRISLLK